MGFGKCVVATSSTGAERGAPLGKPRSRCQAIASICRRLGNPTGISPGSSDALKSKQEPMQHRQPTMSRAFVREDENNRTELPDRPISPHRNFVTEAGLAAIEAALGRFEAAHRAATDKGDRQAAAAALREVRYWRARRASAEVVKPPADKSTASFGMTISLRRGDGREQSFRIVGEDEADPSCGTVSYMSPLARAVLTHGPGETVEMTGGEAVILDVR
jgi:transcription elongation GreA/GreB family factor